MLRFMKDQIKNGTRHPGLARITVGPIGGPDGFLLEDDGWLPEDAAYKAAVVGDRPAKLRLLQIKRNEWAIRHDRWPYWLVHYHAQHGAPAAAAAKTLLDHYFDLTVDETWAIIASRHAEARSRQHAAGTEVEEPTIPVWWPRE